MVNFYIYYNIYIYKLAINLKQYIGIDRYQNISFHWSNQCSLWYEIDSHAWQSYVLEENAWEKLVTFLSAVLAYTHHICSSFPTNFNPNSHLRVERSIPIWDSQTLTHSLHPFPLTYPIHRKVIISITIFTTIDCWELIGPLGIIRKHPYSSKETWSLQLELNCESDD